MIVHAPFSDEQVQIYLQLGRNIRERRKTMGLTQQDLAAKAKLTRTSICNIELGRQRVMLHTLADFAEVLETDVKSLLDGCFKKSSAPLTDHERFRAAIEECARVKEATKQRVESIKTVWMKFSAAMDDLM